MNSSDVTAHRYAEAIFGIGQSTGKLAEFQCNAEDFLGLLEKSKDLSTALSHPNIERRSRRKIVDAVLEKCHYDRVFANFIRLVVERGRASHFANIVSSMVSLRDTAEGRLRGYVYSAQALTPDQKSRLTAKVCQVMGCEVLLSERVDPSLLGGIRVEVDGRVYDSTVRRELEKMREAILSTSARS